MNVNWVSSLAVRSLPTIVLVKYSPDFPLQHLNRFRVSPHVATAL